MAIQTTTNTYPSRGLPGELARDGEPYAIDFLPVQVPDSGRKPRPGDAVYWDATNNGVAAVVSGQMANMIGIVHYDLSKVQDTLSSTPSGADTDQYIEYDDGEFAPIITLGTVYVRAGAACEYGQLMAQQVDDRKWNPDDPKTYGGLYKRSVECVSVSGADGDIIEVRVSGRVR